ncbi:MAG TPA: hypothetical protein VK733_04370, partial [Gemmatimonadaceae bacterium]|nr:hypothetical protein [Gemmatimonadaceae bacterium]
MYPGSPAGADWHRWDLHVHTPSSYVQHYGDATHKATWPKYIDALAALPPSIRALGINDYYSIDGYRQVLQAHADGKLPNIALVLPVVELRLDIFVGTTKLNKINLHVVFSNDITTDEIERWFLDHLIVKRQLADSERTFCLGNATGLIELGQTTIDAAPPDTQTGDHPLKVGFANAAISFNKILEVLSHSVFRDRHLLALGLGEWQQMRWDGAGTVLKRDAIGRVDFVLTAAPTVAKYQEHHAKLIAEKVNPRLFDASDAHYFADSPEHNRLGQSNCWIKADLTFQGLRRAIQRFDDRVFVGSTPPKLDRIRQHNTKYIRRIEIHRTPKATTPEQWFDCHLDLSPDLVAIIGNQGSGKSALTDVIALSGDTDVDDFSFLTPEKFRDPKQRRASQFIAALT